MARKWILFAGMICFTGITARSQAPAKPNIIIILADDLGWGDVGYHGSSIKTPNIDRLAKKGIELNRFYTAAVCSPTRAGLLTGRYPDRFGLRTVIPPWSHFGIDTSEVFLPQMLAEAGYSNRSIVGKWHLGHASMQYHPLSRGFTQFYGHLNGNIDYFTHEREGELDWHRNLSPCYDKGYATDLLADEAIRQINSFSRNSPFFLYLAFNAPHSPLQAKQEDLKGNAAQPRQIYTAMVENLDANIGRILERLEALHIAENTIVVFASDNGAAKGEGGSSGTMRGLKGSKWEGGVRAPAVIRWPAGFRNGRVLNQVTGYIDLMPTLLDIAGVQTKPPKPLDGVSMLKVLTGEVEQIERSFFLGRGAIVNSEWKLVEDLLFHIATDASETTDVSQANSKVYRRLKKELAPYNAITSGQQAPPFGAGRKGFVAPKEWAVPQGR